MTSIRILCIGDVVGAPGRALLQRHLPQLKETYGVQGIIVNGENSANGRGITPKIMRFFKHQGVDIVTSGNHIWAKKEIISYFADHKDLVRPANFPAGCPGSGVALFQYNGIAIGVLNIQGRVFMRELVSCPFRAAETALTYLHARTRTIIVDFHAETSAEKLAMGFYLDGKVSAVVGTHTHVQTGDARVLPEGTAYITDLGMVGSLNSMIGMRKEGVLHNMLTQMPVKFEVDTEPPFVLSGVCIEIDTTSGKARAIDRIYLVDETPFTESDTSEDSW